MNLSVFTDSQSISNYATEGVNWAYREGIIKGTTDTTFTPQENASRAQIAAMLHRFKLIFNYDYRMKYMWNCSKGGIYLTQNLSIGEQAVKPQDPTNFGYRFVGWFTDAAGTAEYTFGEEVTENLTLYAKWDDKPLQGINKYNYSENTIINRCGNRENMSYLPSYNIDDTGFVSAGTKLSDLNGKTFNLFTTDHTPSFSYRNSRGEFIDEWNWFKSLKVELGLSVNYIISSSPSTALENSLSYIASGKQIDIIMSNSDYFTKASAISRSLDGLIDETGLSKSMGVCTATMSKLRKGGKPCVIAPIGAVDVLWYNQTMVESLGLTDPHTQWEAGKWNFDSFKQFILSAPKVTAGNTTLTAFAHDAYLSPSAWTTTNGIYMFETDANSSLPNITNNWDNPKVCNVLSDLSNLLGSCNVGKNEDIDKLFSGTTLMTGIMNSRKYYDTEYSKNIKLNWVPYPAYTGGNGVATCVYNGSFMTLPKNTVKPDNVNVALKFMELWANRYTEAMFQSLNTYDYFNFDKSRIKEYFDCVVANTVYPIDGRSVYGSGMYDFIKCFKGTPSSNLKTTMSAFLSQVSTNIMNNLKFGL